MPKLPITTRRQTPDAIRAAVSGARSRSAILATDEQVAVYDVMSGRVIAEVLQIDGASFREPCPLLVDHDRALTSQIGSVVDIRREGGKLAGTLRFADTDAARDAWSLVSGGHCRSVSVGYRIHTSVEVPRGQSKTIGGRLYTAPADGPLRVVTSWSLKEVSVVTIPADEAAGIRSDSLSLSRRSDQPMTVCNTIPRHSIDQMTLANLAGAVLRSRGTTIPDDAAAALELAFPRRSAVDGTSELLDVVTQWVLDGWRNVPDSLEGVYTAVSADNYLEQQLASVAVHPRMERLGRGQVAPEVGFSVAATGTALMKFGLQFVLDEQDAIDGQRIGLYRVAVEEAARAARNLVSDLLWATVLSNPTLADGVALFDDARGNVGTAAFSDTALKAAFSAIAGQTGADEEGFPVHYNLAPRYLITAPAGLIAAREYLRKQINDGGEITVRSESRLGTAGVLDPRDGETLLVGNGTNWMLAAPGTQRPSIVLSLLGGRAEPTVRQFALDGGQWGAGFDLSFACAVAAIDGRPLYWSTGAESAGE
jgi:HK97 family phage prohead protease